MKTLRIPSILPSETHLVPDTCNTIIPVVVGRQFGDGQALCIVWNINHRPKCFHVRIDSRWLTGDTNGEEFRDHIDDVEDWIREEFGSCNDDHYDEDLNDLWCDCAWPRVDWSCGKAWMVLAPRDE